MSDDLILYTNPNSRGRIARWMLEEAGLDYRVEIIAFGTGKQAAFLALNPMGKVPTLVHGGKVVTEAAAICAYVADAFPEASLAPPPDGRADYYRWLFFAAGPLEAAVTNHALGVDVPDRRAMLGYGSYADTLDALETAVAGRDFVCDTGFTAADVYVGSQILWGLMFKSIEARPAFEAYAARLRARTAYARANALDDADAVRLQR